MTLKFESYYRKNSNFTNDILFSSRKPTQTMNRRERRHPDSHVIRQLTTLGSLDKWRSCVIDSKGVHGGPGGELMKAYPFTYKCYRKLSCVVCKKRDPVALGGTLCKKCCRSRYVEPIVDIPIQVFVTIILPYLALFGKEGLTTIINCSRVSKSMYEYFNDNSIWKYFYTQKKSWELMDKAICSACISKVRINESMNWSREEIKTNPCKLVVKNMTDNIPYIVLYYSETNGLRNMGHIQPGETYIAGKTYANHRWLCFPTKEWWLMNPFSDVGFSFIINPYKLTDYAFSSKNVKPAFVKEIRNPHSPMKPLKGIGKEFKNFKHQYMKLCIVPSIVSMKIDVVSQQINAEKAAIKKAREKLRNLEKRMAQHQMELKGNEYTLKMIKES